MKLSLYFKTVHISGYLNKVLLTWFMSKQQVPHI